MDERNMTPAEAAVALITIIVCMLALILVVTHAADIVVLTVSVMRALGDALRTFFGE